MEHLKYQFNEGIARSRNNSKYSSELRHRPTEDYSLISDNTPKKPLDIPRSNFKRNYKLAPIKSSTKTSPYGRRQTFNQGRFNNPSKGNLPGKPIKIKMPSVAQPRQRKPEFLSGLNELAQEMNSIVQNMPQNRKLCKSVLQKRNSKKLKSKNNMSFDVVSNRDAGSSLRKVREKSKEKLSKNISNMHQFFTDFHKQTRILLKKLEVNVLGEDQSN